MTLHIKLERIRNSADGQTLIALLIFMMLAVLVTTTAVMLTVINSQATSSLASGQQALLAAESGAENALLRLERDPSYSGETMHINDSATATITITGTTTRTITSIGSVAGSNTYKRTVVVTASNSGSVFTVTNWQESP